MAAAPSALGIMVRNLDASRCSPLPWRCLENRPDRRSPSHSLDLVKLCLGL
jgi:hypothetical protein